MRPAKRAPTFGFLNIAIATVIVFAATFAHAVGSSDNPNACALSFAQISPEVMTPERLVSKYLHMPFTTPEQNKEWIRLSKKNKPDTTAQAVHVEFSNLQDINHLTKDKNLVTSITNREKELWFDMVGELEAKYKGKVHIPAYSDFKTARDWFMPKPPAKKLPASFRKDIAEAFQRSNSEFANFIKKLGLNVDGNVENWFRAGVASTADEAEITARLARDTGGHNKIHFFDDPEIQRNGDMFRQWAEVYRQQLINTPALKPLLNNFDRVLDMVKKTPDISRIKARLRAKYGADLTDTQILQLQTYNQTIDKFSLGPYVEERKIASLEKADHGGFSADKSGLSAKNRAAAARAITEGKDLRDVIRLARRNEQQVTAQFQADNKIFTAILDRYYKQTVASGDDFAGVAAKPVSADLKQKLVSEVATTMKAPADQRIAFIGEGVRVRDRNMLGFHGENIEKVLRETLEGRVDTEKLDHVFFGIDMHGKTVGHGDVSLLVGEGPSANLTARDQAEIQQAFKEAVQLFNLAEEEDKTLVKLYTAR